MNQSGKAVRACANFYHLESPRILVVHDDLDLPVGRIKIIRDGGAGGHKGVSSVIEHLGTKEFPRIKIGIGRPGERDAVEDYVLTAFHRDEMDIMERVFHEAVHGCEMCVSEGVESAMNHINRINLMSKEEIR